VPLLEGLHTVTSSPATTVGPSSIPSDDDEHHDAGHDG
jgi:hypothetical protein